MSLLYAHTISLTMKFQSCIGMRFSLIEIKTFLYILLTNFLFEDAGLKIIKANVFVSVQPPLTSLLTYFPLEY